MSCPNKAVKSTINGAMLFEFNLKSIFFQLCDLDDDSSIFLCFSFHHMLHALINQYMQTSCKSAWYIACIKTLTH